MAHIVDPDQLADAAQRLVRTVDGLAGDDWTAPSLLPDWSRAHVVAHLALNGEGLAGVLQGVEEGRARPMYASPEQRDSDIEQLAGSSAAELRERLMAAVTTFNDAVRAMPPNAWTGRFERTPGGQSLPLDAVPLMRLREIEIHHADLGRGYSPADWSPGFAELVVESMTRRLGHDPGFRVAPTDSSRTWDVGAVTHDPPVVTGPVADVAWWLTGRTPSDRVRCTRDALPTIGAW